MHSKFQCLDRKCTEDTLIISKNKADLSFSKVHAAVECRLILSRISAILVPLYYLYFSACIYWHILTVAPHFMDEHSFTSVLSAPWTSYRRVLCTT